MSGAPSAAAAASMPYTYGETLLEVRDVSRRFGDAIVLRDVDFEIKDIIRPGHTQGQVVGLLGPSGMGKTVLFKILAGLDTPDEGVVIVKGKLVQRGEVGVVAQHYPLFAHRTVLSNLTVAGRQAGLSGGEAGDKAMAMLKRFGLETHGAKYPPQLSGGQRQRVAIAQQFMCSEHFLLMDEPFSGLDLVAVERVIELINEIAASDELKTFIIVTHDITAAMEVADTIWLLGRDRDEQGNILPGARIKASYNLIERGLAWRHGITTTPQFVALNREIRDIFPKL